MINRKNKSEIQIWWVTTGQLDAVTGKRNHIWLNSVCFLVCLCIQIHNTGHDVLHHYKYQILRIQKRNFDILDVTHYFNSVYNCQNSTSEIKQNLTGVHVVSLFSLVTLMYYTLSFWQLLWKTLLTKGKERKEWIVI